MAKIEGIRIANYRVLKDLTLGKLWNTQRAQPLTPMSVVIGKNGVGKSSLFDAFGFLADCLKLGVEEACDARGRGGFERIRSQGSDGPIEFEIYYREEPKARPITYELAIDSDDTGRPYVSGERLRQRRKGQKHGRPFSFLMMNDGRGLAWKGEAQGQQIDEAKGISSFRQFVEGWYLSCFAPDAARGLPLAGPQKHLNIHGDNLGNVVQFMEREHRERFKGILDRIAGRIPGIDRIDTEQSPDGRLLLRFNDKGFDDPFYAQQMSDGTLKVFAYLVLLMDPQPPPFICIEAPENGLHHKLLEVLAEEFRAHATGGRKAPQLFVTTYQPYFVDALKPEETWILEKQADGFARISRASDDKVVGAMVKEGLPLGGLWYSDYLDLAGI